MLYDEIMQLYGLQIILSGVLTFFICGFFAFGMAQGSLYYFKKRGIDEITCYATIVKKDCKNVLHFEIESGEIVKLKLKRNDYAYLFEKDEGVLTYRGNRFIEFDMDLHEDEISQEKEL